MNTHVWYMYISKCAFIYDCLTLISCRDVLVNYWQYFLYISVDDWYQRNIMTINWGIILWIFHLRLSMTRVSLQCYDELSILHFTRLSQVIIQQKSEKQFYDCHSRFIFKSSLRYIYKVTCITHVFFCIHILYRTVFKAI